MKRVTILDYGAGNLHSLAKALTIPGVQVVTESDAAAALDTDVLILPGVGNFAQATSRLAAARDAIRDAIALRLPTVGICLGMQLLFEESDEGPGAGLSVIEGRVSRLRATRVPQIGWNTVESTPDAEFANASLTVAYFANSFACRPADDGVVLAWSTHEGDCFPAIVRRGSAVGVQFHPEKSGRAGVQFLRSLLSAELR